MKTMTMVAAAAVVVVGALAYVALRPSAASPTGAGSEAARGPASQGQPSERGTAALSAEASESRRPPTVLSGEGPGRAPGANGQPTNFSAPTDAPPPVEPSGVIQVTNSVGDSASLLAEFELRYAKVPSSERMSELERLAHLKARVEAGEPVEVKLMHGLEGLEAEIQWLIENPGS